jgi:hypothetical protein
MLMPELLCLLVALMQNCPAVVDSTSVLFVGNSHTYVNDLPALFAGLSQAGGRSVAVDQSTVGGYSLQEHSVDPQTRQKIARGGWDFVVLQEQSQIPTIEFWRTNGMFPAARVLDSLTRFAGGATGLFMTWGWRNGGTMTYRGYSSPPFRDYFQMQDTVSAAYSRLATELSADLVPVGRAWARARLIDSLVALWQPDNSHATLQGTYLAACVFYAVLHQASPVGLDFTGGLPVETAGFCQRVAWEAVSGGIESATRRRGETGAVRAFPNPCSGWFLVEPARVGEGTGFCRIRVRDVAGRLLEGVSVVHSGRAAGARVETGMTGPGLLFVQVNSAPPVKVVCR